MHVLSLCSGDCNSNASVGIFNTLKQTFSQLQIINESLIAFALLPLILRINCPCISCLRNQSSRYLGMCLSVSKITLQIEK